MSDIGAPELLPRKRLELLSRPGLHVPCAGHTRSSSHRAVAGSCFLRALAVPLTGAATFGVLDLRVMDVLERGSDLAETQQREQRANANSLLYLREMREEYERDALRGVRKHVESRMPSC